MPVKINSICPYCGCGCEIGYIVKNGRIVGAEAVPDDVVSRGRPCIKGLTSYEGLGVERLTRPMIRESIDEKFRKVSWEEAYAFIKRKMGGLGPEEVYFTGSGEFTNEDNFLLQKFARVVFKTNNIDCCARLCHIPTTYATQMCFGLSAYPCVMDDVLDADVIFAVGTNPASNYPVFFDRIVEAKKKGAVLITVGPRNLTSAHSDVHLDIEYGTLIVLLSGLINAVISAGRCERAWGFEELARSVRHVSPENVADVCRISVSDFKKVADLVVGASSLALMHGMGLTQHENGTQHALAMAALAILKGGKLTGMRGKVNVQGAGDMMCCPDIAPFKNCSEVAERIWGCRLPRRRGLALTEIFERAHAHGRGRARETGGRIRAFYVMGMNPAQSLPDLNVVHARLKEIFVVYHHHHPSVTMEFAHVVLPAAALVESEGTITTGERRVRHVQQVIGPPGGKQNWEIICELARTFGHQRQFAYKSPEEIFKEIVLTIPDYAGLSWDKIKRGEECFANKKVEFKRLHPLSVVACKIERSERYPFFLTTSRWYHQFCTGELSRRSRLTKVAPRAVAHMNKTDAQGLGIRDGDLIKIISEVGEVEIEAKIDPFVKQGVVRVPFHFEDALINKLIPGKGHLDAITKTPNYKVISVAIQKVKK